MYIPDQLSDLVIDRFDQYLDTLESLVRQRTTYTEPHLVEAAMRELSNFFCLHLQTHLVTHDPSGNLLCVPHTIRQDLPLLYLSAHLDTGPCQPGRVDTPLYAI